MELISGFDSAKLNGRTVEAAVSLLSSDCVCVLPLSSLSAPRQSVLDRGSRPGCGQVLRDAGGRGERQLPDEQRPDAGRRRAGDWHPEEGGGAAGEPSRAGPSLFTQHASLVVLGCETLARAPQSTGRRLGTMWKHESRLSHKSPSSAGAL